MAEPALALAPPAGHHRLASLLGAGALLLLGLGGMVVALSSTPLAAGGTRVVLGVVAVAVAWAGWARTGTALAGPRFDPAATLAGIWLVLLVSAAVFADLLPLANHNDVSATVGVTGNLPPDLLSSHPLGTNNFGLDLLARSIHGARVSLLTVGVTLVLSLVVGGLGGAVVGYYRGSLDVVAGIVMDTNLAIPPLVLLIAIAAVFGPPVTIPQAVVKTGLALTVVSIPTMYRLARANTLVFSRREFVTASRGLGARGPRVIATDIVPNVLPPLLAYALVYAAVLLIAEGSLAFLGLGMQQPEPTWGNMIAEGGLRELRRNPHVALVPGAFMFTTVLSLNLIGERARRRFRVREGQL